MKKQFSAQRANELVRVFFSCWEKGMTACNAMRMAADMPCSHFWAEPENIKKHIWKVNKHGLKTITNPLLREMVEEVMRRCDGDYSIENIEQVLSQPAPKFYMQPNTARRIIQRELKRRRKCRKQKQSRQ